MVCRLSEPSAPELIRRLKSGKNPAQAAILRRFFKTGPGEYGEGDRFWGLKVPEIRRVLRGTPALPLSTIGELLDSPVHEVRFCGAAALVRDYAASDAEGRRARFAFYLSRTACFNNWDLVDATAPGIVGCHLAPGKGRRLLTRLARSGNLWERRIAMVGTLGHIRRGSLANTFALAPLFMDDPEDLMHKATGWMLREAGKRDADALRDFLENWAVRMPRTMLRYAIEKFSFAERAHWLKAD